MCIRDRGDTAITAESISGAISQEVKHDAVVSVIIATICMPVSYTHLGLRGGKGKLEMHHILKPEELNGHGRMYALVKMEPHSSIGVHDHIGETEPYYVLSGHGTFIDHDGSRIPVGPDDVCIIECCFLYTSRCV